MNACPKGFCGTGLGHSHDGIAWELLPAVPVLGVVDQQMGRVPGPGAKAVEMSAFFQLDGTWFVLGGNPLVNADLVLSSSDMRGPFNVAQKNGILPRGPQIFHRVYSVPDGLLSIPMIWAYRERKYYHVAPLRRIKARDNSLWFTWWEGNNALKRTEIEANLTAPEHPDWPSRGFRPVNTQLDLQRGVVLEVDTALGVPFVDESDLARSASVRASTTYTRSWWPDGYFAPSNAMDGRETTSWKGSRTAADDAV